MKVKTSKLEGAALDWAVAKCEGTAGLRPRTCFGCKHLDVRSTSEDDSNYCTHPAGNGWNLMEGWGKAIGVHYGVHHTCPISATTAEPYSTDWAQGGLIIDRERINFYSNGAAGYFYSEAAAIEGENGLTKYTATGPTKLIAAMRCYVASKLGDEVDIPEELSCQIKK